MKKLVRLDKYLADMSIGTRSEVKNYIKKGRIFLNGKKAKTSDIKIDIEKDEVTFDGNKVLYVEYEYYMLNKPSGVVSATEDKKYKTVIDLIRDKNRKDLFPVGRLDIDTEGLLLITNDGNLAHNLLSPKKHVSKIYYAKVQGNVTKEDVEIFKKGIKIDEEFVTMPSNLKILKSDKISEIELEIYEGKFHQVKRMFEAVDKQVVYLKRLSMGPLKLDNNLKVSDYRKLTNIEIKQLKEW